MAHNGEPEGVDTVAQMVGIMGGVVEAGSITICCKEIMEFIWVLFWIKGHADIIEAVQLVKYTELNWVLIGGIGKCCSLVGQLGGFRRGQS